MKVRNWLQTVSLIVIALTLVVRGNNITFNMAPDQADVASPIVKYVEVVRRVVTDRDALNHGSLGFLVKDGASYDFVSYDQDSRFDKMPMPKLIRVTKLGDQKAYSPVYENVGTGSNF